MAIPIITGSIFALHSTSPCHTTTKKLHYKQKHSPALRFQRSLPESSLRIAPRQAFSSLLFAQGSPHNASVPGYPCQAPSLHSQTARASPYGKQAKHSTALRRFATCLRSAHGCFTCSVWLRPHQPPTTHPFRQVQRS